MLRFWICCSFLVPFALYVQQFGTIQNLSFCMVLATFGHVRLPFLHGSYHVLALQPLICMVFAKFWYFNHWCGFLESFFRLPFKRSFRVSLRVSLGCCQGLFWVLFKGFLSGFLVRILKRACGFLGGFLGFHSGILQGFI